MHLKTGVSGVILAGGKNTRMGSEKALLKIGDRLIIDIISSALRPLTDEILIVSSNHDVYTRYCDRVVEDIASNCGPLGGIHAGLVRVVNRRVLVTACDMPFVSTALARLLIKEAAGFDILVPKYRGYLEPLFAVYNKTCIDAIEERLARGQNKISSLYHVLRVKYLEEDKMRAAEPQLEKVFFNLNTPSDLDKAQSIMQMKK
ncbi:MAG: molybdenum cofactor guanylyltransferase [Firmicutes bacterium]|nr:molybdenum cofactor guanylyltransferase [Bacillota bacterium]